MSDVAETGRKEGIDINVIQGVLANVVPRCTTSALPNRRLAVYVLLASGTLNGSFAFMTRVRSPVSDSPC